MKKVLFVCVENACRSQMAEAFARIHGKDIIEPYSAGSNSSGKISLKAIGSMREVGYDLSTHSSKSLNDIPDIEYDYVIQMGCGAECPYVKAKQKQDWGIPDPKKIVGKEFDEIRDTIEKKVLSLVEEIK